MVEDQITLKVKLKGYNYDICLREPHRWIVVRVFFSVKNILFWPQGTSIKKTFDDWKFHMFKTEQEAKDFLKKANIEHYWNLAHSQAVLEEADT